MKAFWYADYDRLEIMERPQPEPAPGEVLLQVAACGICGSELETFKNRSPRRPPPLIMGHEFCGVVAETGRDVTGWHPGQRVVSNSLVPCGECVRCLRGDSHLCAHRQIFGMHRMGAFAEYVNVPARCLLDWPDGVPAEAACLAEPLANGVHMVGLTRHLHPRRVLVIGAGPIGLMAQQAFTIMAGAEVMVADLSPHRLAVARGLGATAVIDPRSENIVEKALDSTGGEGVDLVIDAVGASVTKRQSLAAARPGGAVVWIGLHENALTFDSYDVTLPEKQVFGTYAATMNDLQTALDLMKSDKLDITTWVQQGALEQSVDLFGRMLRAENSDIKGVIMPEEAASSRRSD